MNIDPEPKPTAWNFNILKIITHLLSFAEHIRIIYVEATIVTRITECHPTASVKCNDRWQ